MTTCAIVGNAESIFGKKHGKEIDSHDIVIRINRPAIKSVVDQGEKITLMFVHDGTIHHVDPNSNQYKVFNIDVEMKDEISHWAKIISRSTKIEGAKATTGFLAIAYALSKGYDVNLYGFDWYDTDTHYLAHLKCGPWNKHHPEWEREQVSKWITKDQIH